jgi:hypothetical protein
MRKPIFLGWGAATKVITPEIGGWCRVTAFHGARQKSGIIWRPMEFIYSCGNTHCFSWALSQPLSPDDPQHLAMFVTDVKGKLVSILYHNTKHPTISMVMEYILQIFRGKYVN